MFYPQAMSEVELIVPARDLVAVTKVLSSEGTFQQADANNFGLENRNKDQHWTERAGTYAALERRIQAIMQALGMDEGSPPSADLDTMVDTAQVTPEVERIEKDVRSTSDALAEEQKRVEQLDSTRNQLEPVADVDIDMSALRNPRYVFLVLGTMPNDNIDRLRTSLQRVPHVFEVLRQEPNNSVVWLAGAQQNADILDRAARSAYINPVSLPDNYHGTPAQIIADLKRDREAAQQKIGELERKLVDLCEAHESELQSLLWQVRASRLLADAIVRFGRLQYTYVVVGWVPTEHMEDLTRRIKEVSKETLIETSPLRRDRPPQDVPVSLRNPRMMKPFQSLVTTYARPRYNELDPTFLIAITFPLLFGAMFGDVGQGIVLAVLGWALANRKIKALNSLAGLGGLIAACGISATIFGFLYGSVFGFEEVLHAIWIQPLHNIMTILIVAIVAGVVILTAGFLIGIFNAFVARDWGNLLFNRNGVAGLVLYLSLIVLVVGVFTKRTIVPTPILLILAVLGGLAIAFSEPLIRLVENHRPLVHEGIGTFAIQAFFELFETLISFLSNSLSYVRVGAFAVAHAGLSSVFFILAEMISPGHGIGYWLMVIFGNIFIVGFEGLIVGIQTMRLEYYEFFSKFFKGGGSTYEPLTLRPAEEE